MKKALNQFLAILLLLLGWHHLYGGTCRGDSASFKIVPERISERYARLNTPVYFVCDTMIVPKGKTSYIFAGAQIAWAANTSKNKVIHVYGNLIIEGWEEEPVTFAGSLKQFELGLKPSDEKWGGILVEEEGSVIASYANFFHAPVAIASFSEKVQLKNVFLRDVEYLFGPLSNTQITTRDYSIKSLDFSLFDGKNSVTSNETQHPISTPTPTPKKPDATAVKQKNLGVTWWIIGGGALAAGAGLTYYFIQNNPGPTNPLSPDTPGSPDPILNNPSLPTITPRN